MCQNIFSLRVQHKTRIRVCVWANNYACDKLKYQEAEDQQTMSGKVQNWQWEMKDKFNFFCSLQGNSVQLECVLTKHSRHQKVQYNRLGKGEAFYISIKFWTHQRLPSLQIETS